VKNRVCAPLGMTSTFVAGSADDLELKTESRAHGHDQKRSRQSPSLLEGERVTRAQGLAPFGSAGMCWYRGAGSTLFW
jgi:hypothetical protein